MELTGLSGTLRRVLRELRAGLNDQQNLVDRHVGEMLGHVADWVGAHDSLLQWNASEGLNGNTASTLAPTAGARTASCDLVLTDALNAQDIFDQSTTVLVTITGGTAAGKKLAMHPHAGDLSPSNATLTSAPVDPQAITQPEWTLPTEALTAGPITVSMQDGKATIDLLVTGAGTLILGLSAPSNASLDVTDVLTVTFS